tara:strand:- start:1436 stop:1960 length:525 start_codon:yes stop_codon:yes gene_type:complete
MNMIQSVENCFSKYATFEGVASRSEFWWFMLFYSLMYSLGITLDGTWDFYDNQDLFSIDTAPGAFWEHIFFIILFLPTIAVSCRRLHDIGKSGWWQLIYLTVIGIVILIIWWCTEGETTKKEIHKKNNIPSLEKEIHEEIHISSADELKKWAELRDTGAITEEEYQKKKEELLK